MAPLAGSYGKPCGDSPPASAPGTFADSLAVTIVGSPPASGPPQAASSSARVSAAAAARRAPSGPAAPVRRERLELPGPLECLVVAFTSSRSSARLVSGPGVLASSATRPRGGRASGPAPRLVRDGRDDVEAGLVAVRVLRHDREHVPARRQRPRRRGPERGRAWAGPHR